MNNRYVALTIMLTPLFIFAEIPPQNFEQCPDTQRLEKQLEEITSKMLEQQQQHAETQEQLAIVIAFMKHREAIEYQARQRRLDQAQEQEEEQQKIQEWFDSLPAWKRHPLIIYATVEPFVMQQLWPNIKALLTQMLARKILEKGLNTADFCTGTLPEKAGIPIIAFRFGEWVSLDSEQLKNNAKFRMLNQNPEYHQLRKQFEQAEKSNSVASQIITLSSKLSAEKELAEKIADEQNAKRNKQTELDRVARLNHNETPTQRAAREQKSEGDVQKNEARRKIEHERNKAQLQRLQEEKEYKNTAEMIARLLQERDGTTRTNPAAGLD